MMLVVRLTHVDHALIHSVDIVNHGDILLIVHVQAARGHHLLQEGVLHAAAVVVPAVANLDGLVFQIGFLGEEGIVQCLLSFIILRGMNLKGIGHPGTAPSTASLQLCFLIDQRMALGIEKLEVAGAVPVHVPVAPRALASPGTSLRTLHEDAQRVRIEVLRRGHHRNHGQRKRLVLQDKAAGDHGAGEIALAEQGKAEDAAGVHAEESVRARKAVRHGGRGAVAGIAQGTARRDTHAEGQRAAEYLAFLLYRGGCEPLRAECHADIRCRWGRCAAQRPLLRAVRHPGIAGAGRYGRIFHAGHDDARRSAQVEAPTLGVQFQVHLAQAVLVMMSQP